MKLIRIGILLLAYCALSYGEIGAPRNLSYEEFTDLASELSHKVNLFQDTWKEQPDAEFFGGTTRDFLYWVLGNFKDAKSPSETKAVIRKLRAMPVIDIKAFIVGDSDVDVLTNKSLKISAETYGIRKIDSAGIERFDPSSPSGKTEINQGYLPMEKIRLGEDGLIQPKHFGDGAREIYEGQPTAVFTPDAVFDKTEYVKREMNHKVLLAIRYMRLVAMNYYYRQGKGEPDEADLLNLDSASSKQVKEVIEEAISGPGFQEALKKGTLKERVNRLIKKSFRSYTNPNATRDLAKHFGLDTLVEIHDLEPLNQFLFAKSYESSEVDKALKQYGTSRESLFLPADEAIPNLILYHGAGSDEAFRGILYQGALPSSGGSAGRGLYSVVEKNRRFAEDWGGDRDRTIEFSIDPNARVVDITQGEGKRVWDAFEEKHGKDYDKFSDLFGVDILRYPYHTHAVMIKNSGTVKTAQGVYRKILPLADLIEQSHQVKTTEDLRKLVSSLSVSGVPEKQLQMILENISLHNADQKTIWERAMIAAQFDEIGGKQSQAKLLSLLEVTDKQRRAAQIFTRDTDEKPISKRELDYAAEHIGFDPSNSGQLPVGKLFHVLNELQIHDPEAFEEAEYSEHLVRAKENLGKWMDQLDPTTLSPGSAEQITLGLNYFLEKSEKAKGGSVDKQFARLFLSSNPEVARHAISFFAKRGIANDEVKELLLKAMEGTNAQVRWWAIYTLLKNGVRTTQIELAAVDLITDPQLGSHDLRQLNSFLPKFSIESPKAQQRLYEILVTDPQTQKTYRSDPWKIAQSVLATIASPTRILKASLLKLANGDQPNLAERAAIALAGMGDESDATQIKLIEMWAFRESQKVDDLAEKYFQEHAPHSEAAQTLLFEGAERQLNKRGGERWLASKLLDALRERPVSPSVIQKMHEIVAHGLGSDDESRDQVRYASVLRTLIPENPIYEKFLMDFWVKVDDITPSFEFQKHPIREDSTWEALLWEIGHLGKYAANKGERFALAFLPHPDIPDWVIRKLETIENRSEDPRSQLLARLLLVGTGKNSQKTLQAFARSLADGDYNQYTSWLSGSILANAKHFASIPDIAISLASKKLDQHNFATHDARLALTVERIRQDLPIESVEIDYARSEAIRSPHEATITHATNVILHWAKKQGVLTTEDEKIKSHYEGKYGAVKLAALENTCQSAMAALNGP